MSLSFTQAQRTIAITQALIDNVRQELRALNQQINELGLGPSLSQWPRTHIAVDALLGHLDEEVMLDELIHGSVHK